jgi:hypothetical protein
MEVAPPLAPGPALEPAAAARLALTPEEQDAENGIYHAKANTKIVFFGDPEGNSLIKLLRPIDEGKNEISITDALTSNVSNLTELDPYFDVMEDNLALAEDVILVCLGDVIGDGPDNIALATTLLKLKRVNPTRVILISGNRDFSKIRLGGELEPTDVCMAELITKVEDFVDGNSAAFVGFKFEFKRNDPADFDYLWNDNPKLISEISTCLERVIQITEKSMGESCAWKFLVDEYLRKKRFEPEVIAKISLEYKSYIYVYLVQAMSGAIECGVPDFNGIFEKLIMKGHLMASIETPDRGTFGLMHSLPPRGLIPIDPGRIYGKQIKYEGAVQSFDLTDDELKTTANPIEVKDGLPTLNNFVKELYANSKSDERKRRELDEFASGVTSGSFEIYKGVNRYTGLNLPVAVQEASFSKKGLELLSKTTGILVQGGGGMKDLKSKFAIDCINIITAFTRIICSHKPQGYVGAKVKFGEQMYYCVDVSKMDDQLYHVKTRYGCCFLVFDLSKDKKRDDSFIGRIMMKKTQFPDGYEHKVFVPPLSESPFYDDKSLYVNYVKTDMTPSELSTFISTPAPGNFPQNLKLTYLGQSYNFAFKNGAKFMKEPTLTAVAAGGGSRTRKRPSKYLKRSVRTTHKRRISKKLVQKNNKRKNKKSKRASTSR